MVLSLCCCLMNHGYGQTEDQPLIAVHDSTHLIEAQPKGGNAEFFKFLADFIYYPTRCQSEGINGHVLLRFMVDVDGSISKVVVLEQSSLCPEFSQEAIRIMSISPRWIPAQLNGKAVKSYRTLPIRFNITSR